jgi:hypothetical protein
MIDDATLESLYSKCRDQSALAECYRRAEPATNSTSASGLHPSADPHSERLSGGKPSLEKVTSVDWSPAVLA